MTEPLLQLRGLSWAPPGNDEPLFEELDLEIDAGERVVLSGPSGSGKSTVLRCIAGLEPKRAGTVYWRGSQVDADTIQRFRNRAVFVQQRPTPLADTVGEDLAFARRMADHFAKDVEPLDEAGQRDLCDELGLDGVEFSRAFDDLSQGEQQRVALVRALTGRPALLLLDEPTSALDPERVSQIEQLLTDYVDERPDDRAFLWVSHQTEQAERLASRHIEFTDLLGGHR